MVMTSGNREGTEYTTGEARPYVLAVVGSRRRRNTWGLVESLRQRLAAAGFELVIESIHDTDIRDCVGCHRCVEGGQCAIKDGMSTLKARIRSAAGIVLASPVYMCGVSGRLKSAIDRTAEWFHRPVLAGKPCLCLVTTAGSYEQDTLRYLSTVAMHWGLLYSGGAVRNAGSIEKPITEKESGRFLKSLVDGPSAFSPSFRQLALFQVQKVLALKILPIDREYWMDQGWADQVFYIRCRTRLWKRIMAWGFYRVLYARIKGFDADEAIPVENPGKVPGNSGA